jgi:ribonuclease-3
MDATGVSGYSNSVHAMTEHIDQFTNLDEFEELIGYRFTARNFAAQALTHRSWANEQAAAGSVTARRLNSEALEFVGDSVLGCVVAERLFRRFPEANEGELSRMKHHLVSAATLAVAAERINLGEFLLVGRGEEKTGGRQKPNLLSDAFEAVIGAVFFDAGYDAAKSFVERNLGVEFGAISPELAAAADFKTLLQEALQARQLGIPQYRTVETKGPAHRRSFLVEVSWEGGARSAEGDSKKAAEIEAARQALLALERTSLAALGD